MFAEALWWVPWRDPSESWETALPGAHVHFRQRAKQVLETLARLSGGER